MEIDNQVKIPNATHSNGSPEINLQLLTETDVSNMLKVSLPTLRKWRVLSKGPAYCKVGNLVRYDPASILSYIRSRVKGGEQN